jgi:hypothetical protein
MRAASGAARRSIWLLPVLAAACAPADPARPPPSGPPASDAALPTPSTDRPAPDGPPPAAPDAAAPPPRRQPSQVTLAGMQLMVAHRLPSGALAPAASYDLRGISWNPYGIGDSFTDSGENFLRWEDRDIPLMKAAGINTVKIYGAPPLDRRGLALLDQLDAAGIMVVMTVFSQFDVNDAEGIVEVYRDHPAILMWLVGNEWNVNLLYTRGKAAPKSIDQCAARLAEVVRGIRRLDGQHPVATSYGLGTLPAPELTAAVPVDVWGFNVYVLPLSLGDVLDVWPARRLPFFISEYGTDAMAGAREDPAAQARALTAMTDQIRTASHLAARGGSCLGGTPFEWSDEWWKAPGSPANHDPGGTSNGAFYPDGVANQEWFGIVDIDRKPRPAYGALEESYGRR